MIPRYTDTDEGMDVDPRGEWVKYEDAAARVAELEDALSRRNAAPLAAAIAALTDTERRSVNAELMRAGSAYTIASDAIAGYRELAGKLAAVTLERDELDSELATRPPVDVLEKIEAFAKGFKELEITKAVEVEHVAIAGSAGEAVRGGNT